jgi:hypothetical protein
MPANVFGTREDKTLKPTGDGRRTTGGNTHRDRAAGVSRLRRLTRYTARANGYLAPLLGQQLGPVVSGLRANAGSVATRPPPPG